MSNTVLLVAIVAAFLGVLGTAVGIPLYLLDGNIRELGDGVEALEDDLKELEDEIDAKFIEQDAKFDAKLTALEDKMDARFAEQDARLAALENGQTEIDRKLTALIAHLHKTEAVETALEGRLE